MAATVKQARDFIEEISPLIKAEADARGYKVCSTVIAQACCESAYGTSSLAYKYHNYFGMKCGSVWTGPSVNMATQEEYTPGKMTKINDNFRVYSSMKEGVKGYYDFINWSNYANLKTAENYTQYAEMLKADGYATSSSYVSTLCSIVKQYGLNAYDNAVVIKEKSKEVIYSQAAIAMAREVIEGKYGNYPYRKDMIYNAVQECVNAILKGEIK